MREPDYGLTLIENDLYSLRFTMSVTTHCQTQAAQADLNAILLPATVGLSLSWYLRHLGHMKLSSFCWTTPDGKPISARPSKVSADRLVSRCFVYLFPSTQTWFLFLVMVTLT